MKHRACPLIATCVCAIAALAAHVARAQDNTGADRPTTAPATQSGAATSNGVAPAPGAAGRVDHVDRADGRTGNAGRDVRPDARPDARPPGNTANTRDTRTTRTTHHAKQNTHSVSQPSIGSAASDAKGQ